MSLKENLQAVKEELSSEEKFFESAVKTERFVKKYKKPLIMTVVAIVLLVIGMALYEANKAAKTAEANDALMTLQNDPNDKNAMAKLQQIAPDLYDVWRFSQAMKSKDVKALQELSASKAAIISDLAAYEAAVATNDVKAVEKYMNDKDAIYRDLAILVTATSLIKEGKASEAHEKLKLISQDSPVYEPAQTLMHYGIK